MLGLRGWHSGRPRAARPRSGCCARRAVMCGCSPPRRPPPRWSPRPPRSRWCCRWIWPRPARSSACWPWPCLELPVGSPSPSPACGPRYRARGPRRVPRRYPRRPRSTVGRCAPAWSPGPAPPSRWGSPRWSSMVRTARPGRADSCWLRYLRHFCCCASGSTPILGVARRWAGVASLRPRRHSHWRPCRPRGMPGRWSC